MEENRLNEIKAHGEDSGRGDGLDRCLEVVVTETEWGNLRRGIRV